MVRLVRLGWLVRLGQLVRLGSLGRLLPGPAGATGLKWTELRRTGAVPELGAAQRYRNWAPSRPT